MKIELDLSEELAERLIAFSDYEDKEVDEVAEEFLSQSLKDVEKKKGLVGFKQYYYEYSKVEEKNCEDLPIRE